MKICVINNLYPPFARGGAEQVVEQTVEGLLAKGHSVVLITSSFGGEQSKHQGNLIIREYKPKNLFFYTEAHKHNILSRFIWHIIDMFNIGSARFVRHVLEKEKPDVVHTHNLMGVGFLIPRVIRSLNIRHVHTVHDVQLVEPSGIILKTKEKSWRYNSWLTAIYSGIMKKLINSPDVVISPSQFLLDFYKSRGFFTNSKIMVIRNPLTFEFLENKSEIKNFKGHDFISSGVFGNANKIFNFLYLGQIEKHKGIFTLFEAFHTLNDKIKNKSRLHIVGGGSQFEILEKLTRQDAQVVLHGRVEREGLPGLFRDMNITVVPSLCYENSPTVIFESLYFHVPVLASNIEGIAELIEEGENGLVFEAGEIDFLRKKMEWCVEHREEVKLLGLGGEDLQKSQERYVEKISELYQK